jgi:acyl-coenzyme A thioesterase PaaI-like protein
VHRGRKVVTTEARAEDAEGRLLAHATSTILVLDEGAAERQASD